ncbi:hypothetical protein TNCV_826121 [Trichonephila clavipes]|nr:hypothetical protein TNCV_826121 [Trichonephila clavipes]
MPSFFTDGRLYYQRNSPGEPQRGESPPQFLQGHQQGRGPGEKRPTKHMSCPVPVRQEELKQSRKDQSGPYKTSLGGQVYTPCATNIISVEDKSNAHLEVRSNERPVASGRPSPYIIRAGGVETARNRKSRVQPYKRWSKGTTQEGVHSRAINATWINWRIVQARNR